VAGCSCLEWVYPSCTETQRKETPSSSCIKRRVASFPSNTVMQPQLPAKPKQGASEAQIAQAVSAKLEEGSDQIFLSVRTALFCLQLQVWPNCRRNKYTPRTLNASSPPDADLLYPVHTSDKVEYHTFDFANTVLAGLCPKKLLRSSLAAGS